MWSYCLMPNHVHIVAVPQDEDGLARAFSQLHRRYTGYINARMRVTGHLWQGCFGSVAMNEERLVAALRYVALNPVRARLVDYPRDWTWSSILALIAGRDDHVVKVGSALERVGDFTGFLGEEFDEARSYSTLRKAETVGRPIGSSEWLAAMERQTGRKLAPAKRGRRPSWEE